MVLTPHQHAGTVYMKILYNTYTFAFEFETLQMYT